MIVKVAIGDAAAQVAHVGPETADAEPLWAVTWRTTAAAWMLRNRRLLQNALQA